ncbi:hypothetical protein PAXRUDRAFT_195654 [Paxillus rubicundulus Ve08.2h10]|uniref:Uncharacterized protein n=1 Tax=Paxillus rubicundulus Ve08.2h10 TaxID=930991 RepID=A0A0D0CEV9_9AGAM|nr:hypothetical protein PAXRUDRAFT_195654 [Paxillus rubicundulus Ve08.2h10]
MKRGNLPRRLPHSRDIFDHSTGCILSHLSAFRRSNYTGPGTNPHISIPSTRCSKGRINVLRRRPSDANPRLMAEIWNVCVAGLQCCTRIARYARHVGCASLTHPRILVIVHLLDCNFHYRSTSWGMAAEGLTPFVK